MDSALEQMSCFTGQVEVKNVAKSPDALMQVKYKKSTEKWKTVARKLDFENPFGFGNV